MPESLKESEIQKDQDPWVAKQWDNEVPLDQKFDDFAAIADKEWMCMMSTTREGIGSVARAMGVAKRSGPDFLFIANANSKKVDDLKKDARVTITLQNSSNTDWISVAGEAIVTDSNDPRIKDLYTKTMVAFFGNLKDGVHDGGPEDPRVMLIEVQAKYISYRKHESTGGIGFAAETLAALATGKVATPGSLRQLTESEVKEVRSKHASLSS